MTSRDRRASGGATLAERPAPARSAPAGMEREPPPWDELYRVLLPEQQRELLAQAGRQGFLYAHQLPVVDPAALQQRRQFLTQLLAGNLAGLSPLSLTPIAVLDESLDAPQREAVARAVTTPDVCLIQGLPGSGKSRIAAEIVQQLASRGERILLLAATPAGVDRVLEQLGPQPSLYPLRCLTPGEKLESLPACVRSFTMAERTRSLCETAVQAAAASATQAEEHLRIRQKEQEAWDELTIVAGALQQSDARQGALQNRRNSLASEVRTAREAASVSALAGSFASRVFECLLQRDQRLAANAAKKQALEQQLQGSVAGERSTLVGEYNALRPLVEAWQAGRWWTPGWWQVFFDKSRVARAAEITTRLTALERQGTALASDLQLLEVDRKAAETVCLREQEALSQEEMRRLQSEIDREIAAEVCARETLLLQWDHACAALQESSPRPTPASVESVHRARTDWQPLLEREREAAVFARRWALALAEAAPSLPERISSCANLVAASPAGLAAHASLAGINFDVLLIDEADLLADIDLLAAARRACRWVLIGEPEPGRPSNVPTARTAKVTGLIPGAFHRLWQQLHVAPRHLPFRWSRTADRLCCRLRAVPEEHRHWLECEPVADRPEIEVCILSVPRQEPVLAEVRFPATIPLRQAKDFILRELQEAAAHANGPAYLWTRGSERLYVQTGCLAPAAWESTGIERLQLAEGIHEVIQGAATGTPAQATLETLGFEFDAGAGWDRSRAEMWLATHLGLKNADRTAYLGRLHRCSGELAGFLARAIHHGAMTDRAGRDPSRRAGTARALELIPVPPVVRPQSEAHDPRRAGDLTSSRPLPRTGAGFEVDLSANPSADRLPHDLCVALPRHGLVNYPEALALVQSLESVLNNAAFRAEASSWQTQHRPPGCLRLVPDGRGCHNGASPLSLLQHAPAIMVSALYESQVKLLRLLVSRSAALASAGLTVQGDGRFCLRGSEDLELLIDTPAALRQRECHSLFLSLTRSHASRAVALGDQSAWLSLALTRPSARLLLFADLGNLQKRTQWSSAVDHLDEMAAGRERELVVQLLCSLAEAELPVVPPQPVASPARR